jgi:hypothetical protein
MDDPGHIPCSVMVGSDTCIHPAGLGGSFPFSISGVCEYPIHRVMVNWDPPISQVIHLPGAIEN